MTSFRVGAPWSRWIVLVCAVAGATTLAAQSGQQGAVFRSRVDLVRVDVQIVDGQGFPITTLGPEKFEVLIDGKRRNVVSADIVSHTQASADLVTLNQRRQVPPLGLPGVGRKFVLAIDESSLKVAATQVVMQSVDRFISAIDAEDEVALHTYPATGPRVPFTRDFGMIRREIRNVMGVHESPQGTFHLSLAEVIDVTARDREVFERVMARECRPTDTTCASRLRAEADAIAGFLEAQVMQSLGGLFSLLQQLQQIPGRKTMLLISGGLIVADRTGGRPDASGTTIMLGAQAAAANTNVYILYIDNSFLDAFSANAPKTDRTTTSRDSYAKGLGLDLVAGAAGGTVIKMDAGTHDYGFARVLRETSAYYLLGVEPDDADRDGKLHYLRVNVKQKGATVRSRTQVVIPRR
jgi:VWFA-related protein